MDTGVGAEEEKSEKLLLKKQDFPTRSIEESLVPSIQPEWWR